MRVSQKLLKLFFLLVYVVFLLSACSNNTSTSDNETGAIAFDIEWPSDLPRLAQELNNPSIDCDGIGVSSVVVAIYEATGILIKDQTFDCSRGEGAVDDIPSGPNRSVKVFGIDSGGSIIYSGNKSGVIISSDEVTDIGTITLIVQDPNGDYDSDGVINGDDLCPGTSIGTDVDSDGCPLPTNESDIDGDGVIDDQDLCPNTPSNLEVNANGCPADSDINNVIGMSFNSISISTFTMGSPSDELARGTDETEHQVTLTRDFYMQITEVTQSQWEDLMGSNPSGFYGCPDCPVENVSWTDVQNFITALNDLGDGTYSLPTEAQWEYAARAGNTTAFANGDITWQEDLWNTCNTDTNLDVMGWYCDNSDDKSHDVAEKNPNTWGLYDMHGNVIEWCQDWYGAYPSTSVQNPTGPTDGFERILRGGCFTNRARGCRSADRQKASPGNKVNSIGFRLVREP